MSSTTRQLNRVLSRPVKKLQKPRPLKGSVGSRHSSVDATNLNAFDEIMVMVEAVANTVSKGNFDRTLQANIISMSGLLKNYGQNLEVIYKDQLDRAFVIFRNGCRDENLDYTSRLHLLELIELRAMNWLIADGTTYYKHKYNQSDMDIVSLSSLDSLSSANVFQNSQLLNSVISATSQPLLLGPGEVVKSSGKFPAPTMVPNENYAIDEVVIRNSESGKVMGIRGRRVHMIEELSNTVISFQRVDQGVKERRVQITGPSEEKIIYAKQLIEETIKRNASPIRPETLDKEKHNSNSSLNSSASEDSGRFGNINDPSKRTNLFHSFSTSDATIGEFKYTVTIGDETLKITGTNPNLVTIAKLVLDEFFLSESNGQLPYRENADGSNSFGQVQTPQDETDVFKVCQSASNPSLNRNYEFSDLTSIKFNETGKLSEENSLSFQLNDLESVGDLINRKFTALDDSASAPKSEGSVIPQLKAYTREKIIFLADSPYSRKTPSNWDKIAQEFSALVKTPPFEWFDSKTYLQESTQENDASSPKAVKDSSLMEPSELDSK